jgi:hypothetical protein
MLNNQWMKTFLVLSVVFSLILIGCNPTIDALPENALPVQGNGNSDEISDKETETPDATTETPESEETETQEPEETEETEETAPPEDSETPQASTMIDCYQIDFIGKTTNMDGTTAWTYRVMETKCEYDLSYWVLELPGCAHVNSASPEPFEVVKPDPNTELYGIKWETGAGFNMGTFEVTTETNWDIDDRAVAVKGPDADYGEIPGPTCGENWDDEDWDNDYWQGEDMHDDDDDEYDDDEYEDDEYEDESYESRCEDLEISYGQLPPEGKCKIWDPELDEGQQSEPVECDCAMIEPGTCLIDHEGEVVDCED